MSVSDLKIDHPRVDLKSKSHKLDDLEHCCDDRLSDDVSNNYH